MVEERHNVKLSERDGKVEPVLLWMCSVVNTGVTYQAA